MECHIDLREKLLEDGGGCGRRIIFMWPAPFWGGRLGDDGCEKEVGRKEGMRQT